MKKFSELSNGKQFILGYQNGIASDTFLKITDIQTSFIQGDCKTCIRPNAVRLADGCFHLFSPDREVIELHTW